MANFNVRNKMYENACVKFSSDTILTIIRKNHLAFILCVSVDSNYENTDMQIHKRHWLNILA